MHCLTLTDEWHLDTCTPKANRLKGLAILNKHAAVKGISDVCDKDAELITKAVMTMKGGGGTRRARDAMDKGMLWLKRKPFTYRRVNNDWQQGLSTDDWTKEPCHPIDPAAEKPIESLICPMCYQSFHTNSMRVKTRSNFLT